MAEEPLITESKRPLIRGILKSNLCHNVRTNQENRREKIAIIHFSEKTKRPCSTSYQLLFQQER
jgi:hypothetical protein